VDESANETIGPLEGTEPEKPVKRRTRAVKETSESPSTPSSLPYNLDVLWLPDDPPAANSSHSDLGPAESAIPDPNSTHSALPPPEVFQEVLTNFLLTLHPQTQHKAAYATSSGGPVEPTLALYCPIEGGDYIIDETVKELGRRTGAEVVVLDAVQLAAGECGQFEKGEQELIVHSMER
jgi:hypothetical protein